MGMLTELIQRANTSRLSSVTRTVGGYGLGGAGGSTFGQAANAYATSGWLYAIIGRITNGVARVDWQELVPTPKANTRTRSMVAGLARRDTVKVAAQSLSQPVLKAMVASGQMQPATELSPAFKLWSNPNPFYSQHELVEVIQQHLELRGEGWIVVVRDERGVPVELWPVRPDKMTPIPSRDEFVSGYVYKNGNESIPLENDDVIFLRVPSPMDMYRGMGPVQSILYDLDADRYAAQWNRNFFTNGAEPGGIIEASEGLSDAELERLTTQWRSEHQGVNQAHRVAILEKAKWVDRQYTHTDMAFIDGRKWSRDIFLGAFGISGSMIGVSESVNRANAEAGEVMFSRWTVVPRCDRIKMAINSRLQTMFGGSTQGVITYIDPTPEDRQLRALVSTSAYKVGLVTRDEGRTELGLPPAVDGSGDEFFVPQAAGGAIEEPMQMSKALDERWAAPLRAAEREMADAWGDRLREQGEVAVDTLRDLWVDDKSLDADSIIKALLAGVQRA